jgi:hypothetical protein
VTRTQTHEWLRPPQGTKDIPRGTLVRDLDTGHIGILQDVTYLTTDEQPTPRAFLRPVGTRQYTTRGRRWAGPEGGSGPGTYGTVHADRSEDAPLPPQQHQPPT